MVNLKHSEMRLLDEAMAMNSGYVLDFSNRTFSEFFDDEFGINIYEEKYGANGTSKANHLRSFIGVEEAFIVSKVLRRLWEYRQSIPMYKQRESRELEARFFDLLQKIEGVGAVPSTDAIYRFTKDETLDELIGAIERDISANKAVAALDRLHTYCMKKFGHLLDVRGITWDKSEPLHSRVGKYVKAIHQQQNLRDITIQAIKSSIAIFEKFNYIRNNQSLAHDNELLDPAEARFIYDAITAILRFVRSLEKTRFDNQTIP